MLSMTRSELSNLHPNMYLLILVDADLKVGGISTFTSQHVSINSHQNPMLLYHLMKFTSQHVSINSIFSVWDQAETDQFTSQHVSINSQQDDAPLKVPSSFTSQHVSINSRRDNPGEHDIKDLHPNMYLLIRFRTHARPLHINIYIPTCIY